MITFAISFFLMVKISHKHFSLEQRALWNNRAQQVQERIKIVKSTN